MDISFFYLERKKERFLAQIIEEDELDIDSMNRINNSPIEGITQFHRYDKNTVIFYTQGKISLNDYINTTAYKKESELVLKDILAIIKKIENEGYERQNILLNPEYIFIHQITKKPSLIYVPLKTQMERNIENEINSLKRSFSKVKRLEKKEKNQLKLKLKNNTEQILELKEDLKYEEKTEFFQSLQKNSICNKVINANLYWKEKSEKININRRIFKIGRSARFVDFYIDDSLVGNSQADIIFIENEAYVEDKGSICSTYINGKKLPAFSRIALRDGDTISFANEEFVFCQG